MSFFEQKQLSSSGRAFGHRLVLTAGVLVVAMASFTTGYITGKGHKPISQNVVSAGATTMPFDRTKTSHVFAKSATGGTQTIVAANGDLDGSDLAGVRAYLQQEAANFSRGIIRGPNGEALNQGTGANAPEDSRVDVRYAAIPGGARITYTTNDKNLVRSLHAWFDSQGRPTSTTAPHAAHNR